MAAKTKTRRRKVTKPAPLGKTTWAILTPTGDTLRENSYGPGATLASAQHLAFRADTPDELTVVRRDLFGPPAILYTVRRDAETGNVSTEIHSHED